MNTFVQFLLATHPAGGWFRKEASGKRKRKHLIVSFSHHLTATTQEMALRKGKIQDLTPLRNTESEPLAL